MIQLPPGSTRTDTLCPDTTRFRTDPSPSALTYPGVYIEEIPSGVRTITGVATSITAFIGRAARGPIDADAESPVIINSYGDFERQFGSLDPLYPMGYAVRDFYLNGGAQAAIVRQIGRAHV